MDKFGSVQVMDALGSLVDDVAFVLLPQHILADQRVQIDVHELKQYVDISLIPRADHLLQLYYVRVLEFFKEHYLSVSSLRVCGILESIKVFFKSVKFASLAVLHLPNDTVCSAAYFLYDFEPLADMRLNFLVLAHNSYQ